MFTRLMNYENMKKAPLQSCNNLSSRYNTRLWKMEKISKDFQLSRAVKVLELSCKQVMTKELPVMSA